MLVIVSTRRLSQGQSVSQLWLPGIPGTESVDSALGVFLISRGRWHQSRAVNHLSLIKMGIRKC